eukprot:scaffold93021_cov54-Phaeocystis_antarctica.AAC.7
MLRRLGVLLEQLAQVVRVGRLAHDAAQVTLAPLRRRALLAPPRRRGAARLGGWRLGPRHQDDLRHATAARQFLERGERAQVVAARLVARLQQVAEVRAHVARLLNSQL